MYSALQICNGRCKVFSATVKFIFRRDKLVASAPDKQRGQAHTANLKTISPCAARNTLCCLQFIDSLVSAFLTSIDSIALLASISAASGVLLSKKIYRNIDAKMSLRRRRL